METYDVYVGGGDNLQGTGTRPFDDDYMGYDPRLASQRFESFRTPDTDYSEADHEDSKDLEDHDFKPHHSSINGFDHLGGGGHEVPPPPFESAFDDGGQSPAYGQAYGSDFILGGAGDNGENILSPSVDSNGQGFHHLDNEGAYGFPPQSHSFNGSGPILPPLEEMQPEEGFILREWKRMNALQLEEKARNEREALSQIINAADAYKEELYEKRRAHSEGAKKNNRDKEKVFLENQENFHVTADKHYWKAVSELIPHELPAIESKFRGNRDKDRKKPTVVVNQGPKPGKATDLTRMRQVLLKLKHNPPPHMKPPPPPPPPAASGEAPKCAPVPPVEPVSQQQDVKPAETGLTEG